MRFLAIAGLLAVVAVALAPQWTASATVRYVDDSYGGDNAGLNQWTTIQKAINNATNGDTIYIFAGTYAENVIVNKTLNIQGESRNSTIIDPVLGNGLTIQSNNVNLSSFTVTGALYGVIIASPYTNLAIDSLTFEANTRGVFSSVATNVTIAASYFGNHSGVSNYGIFATRGANVTSKNNTFIGNYYAVYFDRVLTGIIRDGDASGNRYGIYLTQTVATTVDRNHVGNSSLSGYGVYLDNDHNSTVSSNRIDNISNYGLTLYYSYSLTVLANDISDCGSNLVLSPGGSTTGVYYGHTIATSNLLEGKPAHYYRNTTNVSVPEGAGWVGAFNVTNLTIAPQNITNELYAVWLVRVTNVQLAGLNYSNPRVTLSGYGVWGYNLTNAVLAGINGTGRFTGAYVQNSEGVSIENGTASGNRSWPAYYAALFYANTVGGLRVLNNTVAYGQGGTAYYSDFALLQNNSFTDSYQGFTLGYGSYPRLLSNSFNNTTNPLTPYGFDVSHFSWTLPVNNTWDGRSMRAFVNTTTSVVSANYAWLLLVNVSNLTVTSYTVNNGSGYAGIVAYSSNVSIGNLTHNSSQSGIYIRSSSGVSVWNSFTNNSGQPFYISASSDVALANGTWANSNYEGFGVDSSSRVTVRNVTFSGFYASYFFEAYSTSELLVDNVTSTQAYQFAYMTYVSFSTFNRVNASIGTPFFPAGAAIYFYNTTDVNFTNSSYVDFPQGFYFDYANWNVRIVNVTFGGLVTAGILCKDPASGNFTVSQTRLVAPGGVGGGGLYGVYFLDLQARLTLSGLNISGFEFGIFVDPMTNVTITGSQINNTTTGIHLEAVSNSTVSLNTIRDTTAAGIEIVGSSNITITGNTLTDPGLVGVALLSSTNLTVTGNKIQRGQVGVRVSGGRGHLVSGNTVNATTDSGIVVTGGHEASTFNSNSITNGYVGFFIDQVQFLTLDSNALSGSQYNFRIEAWWIGSFWHRINATNTVDGKPIYFIVNGSGGLIPTTAGLVILANTTNYLVSGLTIGHNWHGVLLVQSTGITVLNVTVTTSWYSVEVRDTINSSISDSRVEGGYFGILVQSATNVSLLRTLVNGSNYGVYLSSGRALTLTNLTINASLYAGLMMYYIEVSNLTNNRISNTTYGGMEMNYGSDNVLYSNNLTGNRYSFNMNGYVLSNFNHTIPTNNTVDGLQFFYRINTTDIEAPSDAGVVIFANITNGTVRGLRLNNTGSGVIVFGSRFLNISNITLANGNAGVRVIQTSNVSLWNFSTDRTDYYWMSSALEANDNSVNITFVNSTLTQLGQVVYAYYASNITIRNMTLGDMANYSSSGAALWSNGRVDNVTVDRINFSYASWGVYLYGYSATDKASNITVSNSSFGFYMSYPLYIGSQYAENITFFHNNFDMTYAGFGYMQVVDPYNVTRWHRPYAWGGNWWSNWTSPDDYGGASQSVAGGDGIVDYSFDAPYTWDRYPLADPWPPQVALISPANQSAILPGVTLDFDVSLFFDTVKWSQNNGSASAFASPFDINTSGWGDGVYHIWVNATDGIGVADSEFFVFVVDTTAPSISALSPTPGFLYATGTPLNYTISDPHLALNATLDLGGGEFPFASQWNLSTAGLPDGWINVTVRAWDTAGNGASATFNYALDGNAPVTMLGSPANNSVISAGTTVDLSITDAFFQNASWSTGAGWNALASPFDLSTTGWGDGPTTLVVVAFDQLGRPTTASFVFTLDSTLPTTTLNTPANGSTIQAGTTLDLSVADANFQNASWSNGGPWFSFSSPFDISTGGWADGAVTVTVRAFDQAGNSRTSTFDFTVDTTAPTITLGSPVNNSLIAAGSTIDFAISDAHAFSATWNNGNGSTPFSSPFDVVTAGWADGVVTVVVTATDIAGNGRTASFSFDVDGTLPSITLNTPANNSYVSAGRSIDLSVAEAHPGAVTWNNGGGPVGLSSPYDVPTTGWADGSVNVTVIATDAVGNSRTVVFHFTMDSTLPSVSLVSPANNSVVQSGTIIDFAVSDTNLNTVFWVQGNQTLGSPYDVNTSGWADGANLVSVTATDLAGNSRTLVVGITLDNVGPSIGLNQPTNGSTFGAGTLIDLSITDLHALTATWDNGTGTVTLAAPFDIDTTGWTDGNYTVVIAATDVAGNSAAASFAFTIDNAFPAVILLTPANNSVIPSGTVLDFDVIDADLNTVTYDTGSGSSTFSSPYDLDTTGFSEGPLNVTVRADDNSSHIVIVVFRFTIDDTNPVLALTGPANNSVLSAGSTIDLAVTEVNLDYAAYDNGNGTQLLAAPFDIDTSGWSDGGVNVLVTVYDLAGNSAAATFHFTIDSTAPAISLGSPANNSVLSPGATLDFSITDVNSFNATWANGSGPFAFISPFDVATSGWADGAVTVTVRATDIAGNLRVASFAFTIDSIAPAILLSSPSNGSVIPAGTTLDFALTDVHTFNATWSNGSGGPFALASPFDVSTAGWPDAATTVTLSATDVAGNVRTLAFVFTLDSTRPSIALVAPSNNSAIAAGTTLDFTVSDVNLQNATWNNGSGALPLASPFNVATTGWADGPIDVEIVALDLAGNSRAVSFHFEMDSTAPTLTLVAPANNSVIGAGTMIDLNITDLHGVASASWNNGSGAVALPSPFDINTSAWADGDHNLTIVATDTVGNSAPALLIHFFVDRTPPSIVLQAPSAGAVIRPGTTLDFDVTDAYGLGNVSWNNGSGAVGFVAPFTVNTTGWIDGALNVTVTAIDAFGNLRASVFPFTVDGTAPAISLVSPANNSVVTAGTLIDTEIVELHLVSANWNNGTGPVSLSSPFNIPTTGWADGVYTLTVNATDQAGNFASSWFRVTVDTTAPNITLTLPANNSVIAGGSVIDISIGELNLNNASWTNGSLWSALTSPFDVWTTGWVDGVVTVSVSATDLAGNTRTASFRFTMDSTFPTLLLASPANGSVIAPGATLDFDAADANLANVSWNNGSGSNALPDPFDLSTAGWPEGNRNITVTAVDLAGNARTLVFFFTFDGTPPTITLVAPANNTILTAGTVIDLSVSDIHLDTVTWDNSSGLNTLAAPYNISTTGWADGAYNVTVVATDLAGNTRTVVLRYTFDTSPPSITLLSPSNNSFVRAGTALDLLITDLTALTVTWDNGSGPNTLASPFDINTAGWGDGIVDLAVLATDAVGNSRTRVFHFTFDSTVPSVTLLTPTNNSVIRPGVAINLSITDTNLNTATWDNGGGATGFATQWSIPTTGWSEGAYNITIDAADLAGNVRTRIFRFTIDSILPTITLNTPTNNSYIAAGTVLNLTISDLNLATATWDDGTGAQTFATQWNISTTGWSEGPINISVYAADGATNSRTRIFHFTIDSTLPALSLLSPTNNSYLVAGVVINFTLSDTNLDTATWDNGGGAQSFATQWNISTSGWADGPYNITVVVSDLAGNLRTRWFHFTIDSTQPSISLTTPANDSHVDAGTVLTFAIADTNLNVVTWETLSGPQAFAAQWTISTAGWPDASYNITVTASDLAGNVRARLYHIWIDSTLPTVALNVLTPANGSTFDSGATLQFDVTEAHILTATWNNGTSGNVAFGAPFQVSTAGWQDGVFDLVIRVMDRAGHQAYFVYHFTLDSVAPTIANVPWEGGYFEAGWRLNGTYFDTNMAWTNFQVDAAPAQNATNTTYQVDTTGLADGAHSIRVQAGDRAGHVTTRVFLITIDSDPPAIQNILPADGSFFRPGTLITFTVIDNNTANVTWQRNAGALLPANGTGGLRNINTATWGDGNWTVRIFASDLAFHLTSVTLTLVTDATPPSMPPLLAANQTYDEDNNTLLDATSAGDGPNPLPDSSFLWNFTDRLGPQALGPLVGVQVTYLGWTQPGDFEYTLTITDLAGNSANRTYGVHIRDLTAPDIQLSVPSTANEDTPVLLDGSQTTDNDPTFLANDPSCAGGRFVIRASDGSAVTIVLVGVGGPNPTACLAPSHTFAEPGVYSITFNVTDKADIGNSTSWVIRVLDRTGPEIFVSALPAVVNEGANVTLDATATADNDAANVSLINYTWTIRRIGGATATRSGSLANFTFVEPGDYLVNLTARDLSGNRNSTLLSIRVNDIPVLDNSPPAALTLPENMDFRLAITDTDTGDSFNVTNVTPAGIAVGVDSLTGRPRLTWAPTTYGPFVVNFTLSDGSAWVNYSFNITIRVSATDNPPPVWESPPLGELRESITYSYDANARDPAGDTVYYGQTVGPQGMSIDYNSGIVTWYHTLRVTTSDQVFDVNIYAWDGANYIWQNYTVRLRATPNVRPSIEGAGAWSTVSVEEGANFTLPLGSHISDLDDTTWNITVSTFDADKVSAVVVYTGGAPSLRITGISRGNAVLTLRVTDPSQTWDTRDIAVAVTPRATTPPGGGGGESGIGGLIPLIGLGVAGAGAAGFFIVMRGRNKRKEEVPAAGPGAVVAAVRAPTLAAEAGTVVLTAESAAAAAAPVVLAAAPEKKITYTIEGLFVIYKDGRLLYSKTDMGQAKFEDPELVSSMFTAVQSFIKDSFSTEGELNKMGYGDNQIIIERGRSVFTAAIVYGEPDQEFHDAMKAAIENVELSYAGIIEQWDGMMDSFADMDQKLAGVIALSAGITRREVQFATTKQEVLMLSELEFFQGFVRLKCGIKNNTPSVITKATVDIEYNEDVLRLARVEPAAYRTAGAKVLLGVLNPGEKSSVAYYFDPQICTESQIDGVCRYRDASGVLHTVAMKTRKAEVVCPLFFTKEHANTAMLKRLVEAELSEKDSKVFEIQKIPPYIKHKDVFDLIKSVVNAHDVQMVREFTKFNPFHGEAWFYGQTKVKNYKIVIRATVIEETNAIEFFAASTNMKAITGLLAEFNHTLNSMVIEKYSDLKIAQIFDSEAKADIEKKSLMSNMSSAELEGAETEQGGDVGSAPGPAAQPPAEGKPGSEADPEVPEPEDEGKDAEGKPGKGGG